ncbi:unnamed protein product [Thelazia callipaeda]|uniref:CHCH domain-containing protein n=1 Tax=Thelazia callipaeda TaxID=103827 RepID=A0A0N5D4P0_THECL|nr:unnamed protein product [Thelazia callipaeda]
MNAEKQEKEYDLIERSIRKTGCWKQHLACAECMADTKDWRECQEELRLLRECMLAYSKKKDSNDKH